MSNEDYELMLEDRLQVIRNANKKYNLEENAYISFSGGKDSTVLHYLVDMALPNNKIPRLFLNTGIEYIDIVRFVKSIAENDDRFVMLAPTQPIKQMLETYGYPFKSKQHSHNINIAQNNLGEIQREIDKIEKDKSLLENVEYISSLPNGVKTTIKYIYGIRENVGGTNSTSMVVIPKQLLFQATTKLDYKLSDKCCYKMKKEPAHKWQVANNKTITLTGMQKSEGGNRNNLTCIVSDKNGNAKKFHPLAVVDDDFEEWFIKKYDIKLCRLYEKPFCFKRTGCKGCPFALDLQKQLDIMEKYLPNERKQCEILWKPVYDEYRRLNYRLVNERQTDIFDFMGDDE